MEKKQTAMMQLIEDVKANMNSCLVNLNEEGLTELERRHYNSAIIVAKDVIKKATELLTIEYEQIEEAYEVGDKYKTEISGEQYYNKTFKP
jgi:lipopolysaccharide biosynthesis regulator YciM